MAGENLAFPWAAEYDAEQLAAFIEDLWRATGNGDDLATLDAIEKVIAEHAPEPDGNGEDEVPECLLTERQLTILIGTANGDSTETIADRLGATPSTVYSTRQRAVAKTGAHTLEQAIARCVALGWIPRESLDLRVRQWRLRRADEWKRAYQALADDLRQRPGESATAGPYVSREQADRAVIRIQRGWFKPFRPGGSFDARAVCEDSEWMVRARYMGGPASADGAAS